MTATPPRRLRGQKGVTMKKICDSLWMHRGKCIFKDDQGIFVENCLHLFNTLTDARLYIDKIHDGSNKREPVIVGEWSAEKAGY